MSQRSISQVAFLLTFAFIFVIAPHAPIHSQQIKFPTEGRVVFLGDSITYSGQYVAMVESIWKLKHPDSNLEWLNLGLPSETISGLSEKGHAGGRFPRPDLHERLERIIEATRPDIIVACYGMNCGIYRPFSEDRFEAYQVGINQLRKLAAENQIRVIHLTPPCFDPDPIRKRTTKDDIPGRMHVDYNQVLDQYSSWLIRQGKDNKWSVIDAHFPMNDFLAKQKKADPNFRLANDGVHIESTGHWLIAREILHSLGVEKEPVQAESFSASIKALRKIQKADGEFRADQWFKLIHDRQQVRARCWLSKTGHKRPGIPKGASIDDAEKQADSIAKKIQAMLNGN